MMTKIRKRLRITKTFNIFFCTDARNRTARYGTSYALAMVLLVFPSLSAVMPPSLARPLPAENQTEGRIL